MELNWEAVRAGLIALRMSNGITQRQLAEVTGIGEKTISSFESGKRLRSMKIAQFDAIVTACGSTPSEFFGTLEQAVESYGELTDEDIDAVASALAGGATPVFSNYPTPQSSLSAAARNVVSHGRIRR